jgi:hypothetical protein
VQHVWRDSDSFHLDPAAVPAEADLVITGNPNNPTGTLDPAATLATLARPGRELAVDEAFMELTPGETETLAGRRDLPGLVVVRSLTKLWGLAGIRAGYLLAPPALASALRAAPALERQQPRLRRPGRMGRPRSRTGRPPSPAPGRHPRAAHRRAGGGAGCPGLAVGRQLLAPAGHGWTGRALGSGRPWHHGAALS